jgi:hypothetical protein
MINTSVKQALPRQFHLEEGERMQFTPQQLRGGQRYNSHIRVGNWKEDIVGEEIESKEFLQRQKKLGDASTSHGRITKCTQIVRFRFPHLD